MISRFLFISIVSFVFVACSNNGSKQETVVASEVEEEQVPSRPYAELHLPQTIDMGVETAIGTFDDVIAIGES